MVSEVCIAMGAGCDEDLELHNVECASPSSVGMSLPNTPLLERKTKSLF